MSFTRFAIALTCTLAVLAVHAQQPSAASSAGAGALTKSQVQRVLLIDSARAGMRLVAVGDRGYILTSDNNADTWMRVPSPVSALLTAVYFADATNGWIVGHDLTILGTTDGGSTWNKLFSAPDEQKPLLDIYVSADRKVALAVGAYGAFYASDDGGVTWKPRKISNEDKHLNAITALSDGRLMIVGEAGTILFSSDSGTTWTSATSPYNGSYFGVLEAADKSIVMFGMRGRVFRSENAGMTWSAINIKRGDKPFQSSLMGGTRLSDGRIVLAGIQGAAILSSDNGASFQMLETKSNRPYSGAIQSTGSAVVLLGEAGAADFILPSP